MSRTNIDIDENLLNEALKLTNLKTKKAVVNLALQELVKRQKRKAILELEGKIAWEGDLNQMREGTPTPI